MKVVFIVGLAGCGKSTLLRRLEANAIAAGQRVTSLDDPKEADFLSFASAAIATCAQLALIADPMLCASEVRSRAERLVHELLAPSEVEWVFFANDPEQCRRNVKFRADGREVEASIRMLSQLYRIPEQTAPLPVWKGSTTTT